MKTIAIFLFSMIAICLYLPAQIIHVPADQPTIQAGIDAASNGDTVLVTEGIYYENIDFNGKAITLASHFLMDGDTIHINNTKIDGSQPAHPFQGAVVYLTSGEDTTSILCGFTIQNGTGHYPDDWGDRSGGGIYMAESTAKIIYNKIISNTINVSVGAYGGGIAVNAMEDRWVVIRGNTIMNNTAQSSGEKSEGGGIYTLCNAIIQENIIRNNLVSSTNKNYADAKAFGGGASLVNYSNPPQPRYAIVDNNLFQGNTASGLPRGGGIALYKMDGTFSNNLVDNNQIISTFEQRAWGCGIYMDGTYVGNEFTVENNTISNNGYAAPMAVGGGIGMYDMDKTFIVNANIIRNNEAHYGGGICNKLALKVEITNNVIQHNSSHLWGGGIFFTDDLFDKSESRQDDRGCLGASQGNIEYKGFFPLIINNSIVGNDAMLYGGGLATRQENLFILSFNNIFWNNTAIEGSEIYVDEECTLHVYYCLLDTNAIHGPWHGNGNIYGDPMFCDDSCHIDSPVSAAWNNGAGQVQINGVGPWYYSPTYDIDGDIRPMDTAFDIGADEDSLDINPAINEYQLKVSSFYLNNTPNPFKNTTYITYKLDGPTHVRMRMFTMNGQLISTFLDKKQMPGEHKVIFCAGNLPPGIYYCQLWTPNASETQKMVIINK